MPRAVNFGYQDPTQDIGNSLVKAIFGDPALAAKARTEASQQALRQAQTEEARKHGGLYLSQTTAQDGQNDASASLPALFANLAPKPLAQGDPSQPTIPVDPGFAHFAPPADVPVQAPAPAAAPPTQDEAFRAGLPALMAAMSQAKGDKMDPNATIATLASFLGGDEMARRGLISQGHTPGKEFAITSDRADQIATTQNRADLAQAIGTAHENHLTDLPEANIRARSAATVAGINNRDNIPVATIQARSHDYATDAHYGGTAPAFTAISDALPGATMSSGWRSPAHNAAVGGVDNSNHLGNRPGVQAYDTPAQPGMTVEQAAAAIEEKSGGKVRVIEARDERGRVGPNGKALGGWHFALQSTDAGAKPGKPAAAAKAPPIKMVNGKAADDIVARVDAYFHSAGVTLSPEAAGRLHAEAIQNFQQTGNPVLAVQRTIQDRIANSRRTIEAKRTAAAAGAHQAPDGNYYVRTGTKPDGSPAWSRVEQ